MIRAHENPLALRAGALSILVHIVLLAVLLISFNWKAVQPANIAQVELWDSLPTPTPVEKPIEPPPEPPKPVIKEEPKPEPAPEPKAEIQIKKKTPVEEKPKKEEKPKPDPAELKKQKQDEALKKLQQELLTENTRITQDEQKKEAQAAAQAHAAQSAAASKNEVDKYISLVSSKIRPYVNKQLCGSGKPELIYEIALLPTGEISGSPRLLKSSGIAACDDAVERAIRQANPLPKPSADILGQVRDLNLKFRPNDDN